VDSIAVYKDKIQSVQAQAENDKKAAKKDAAAFAHKVEHSVGTAKLHFERMRALLLEYQNSQQKLSEEKDSTKKMKATAALLRKHIEDNKKAVRQLKRKNAKEHRTKREARHVFNQKTRRVKREMEKLQAKMRKTIEAELKRKTSPSVTGQLTYEELSRKTRRAHVKLAKLATQVQHKTRALRKAKRSENRMAKLAAKRAAVLKVARVAYHNLRFAAHTLRKVVQKKVAPMKPKPKGTAGTEFTEKLLDTVTSSVKAAAHTAEKHEVQHLKKDIKEKADNA
jgi:hypothetical protein